jgi:hypothetical protein
MTLLSLYQNHPGTISATIFGAACALTFGATNHLVIAPKTEKITALQQENTRMAEVVNTLTSVKSTSEKTEQSISIALAKAQAEVLQLSQKNEAWQTAHNNLVVANGQWQTAHNNLLTYNQKLQNTCNIINHISQISRQKTEVEDSLRSFINNNDVPRAEEYKRRSVQLQDRLLKLEAGLANTPK